MLKNGRKIAFGVDSFEDYKMWFEENFVELADLLYKKKLFDYIFEGKKVIKPCIWLYLTLVQITHDLFLALQ